MIKKEEALELVRKHVSNENLIKHMIGVGAIMHALAEHFQEDSNLWEVVGILHDIDYEETSQNFNFHGLRSAEIVKDLLPDEALHAIKSHNSLTKFKATSKMDISLFAADAVSGMIVANALVRPSGMKGMKPRSIKRRMKDNSFARQISRENILRSKELGLELNEFLKISIDAMENARNELDL
jgi:putative nucleotidyltransferase with HDIG domain